MEVLPTSLHDKIQKIIKDEGFSLFNVEIMKYESESGNFMGELYKVEIRGETVKGNKVTNVFIKKKKSMNKIGLFFADEFFTHEEFFYIELSKLLLDLQEKANIPVQERYKIPKAYDVTNTDAIYLEDLSKKKFITYARLNSFPLKYVELATEQLAKLHGLSFIIEKKMPQYFYEKIKTLKNIFHLDDDWRQLMRKNCSYIASLYDDEEVKRKINEFLPVIFEKFPKYNCDKITVKCTLSHGDYRMVNVLVREQNGTPVEVMPVDYQFIDYGCPLRDFFCFVFSGTDQEFRRNHLSHLKELYFKSLTKFLKYFDIEVETVYPREEFEKNYSEWLDYGLMLVICGLAFFFISDGNVDLKNIGLSDMSLSFDDRAKNIIRGIVDDFIEWGYL